MSLRQFLKMQTIGNIVNIKGRLDPKHEIAAFVRKSIDMQGPILLFNAAGKYDVKNVIGGVYGSKTNIRRCLSPYYEDSYNTQGDLRAVQRFSKCNNVTAADKLEDYITIVEDAPCQEVVKHEPNISEMLPICTHNTKDAGPFITAGIQVVKWIDRKTHGLGIHRMHNFKPRSLGCLAPPNRRVGYPHYEASKKGEGVKMAVLIGADPHVVMASQSKLAPDAEKYIVASNLKGKRLEMVKCITSDILVPADTEIVLECTSVPNSVHDDTPFAEYPGCYSFRSNSFVVRVDAITMRKDAMYQTILTGRLPQEDSNLCAIPYAAEVYEAAKKLAPEITDISTFLGNGVFDTILCIKKFSNAQVRNLMYTLIGNKYLKSVSIMDDDLKATEEDWRFAFNTRYQPNVDTIISDDALGASLDPSSPLFQSTSKIAFDLTRPMTQNEGANRKIFFKHDRAKTMDIHIKDDWSYNKFEK